ncbi:hypothetical protein LTR85_001813 [Meristemomyces frigidus]|nr:hypothetical protein LTR85_001813 [Meristemomyces frigidus]
MKFLASVVVSMLASVAVARPRAKGDGDILQQKSRITAFVLSKAGEPSVECWEITSVVNSQRIQRSDGSKGTAHALSLASRGEFDGVDILTWPSYAPIWPPGADGDYLHAKSFDLANTFNLFNVQGGLINFNFYAARFGTNAAAEEELHIFSLENGDDWFYFEDNYTGSELARGADVTPNPFTISTISATETEVLRLRYNTTPEHRVVHKGACSFTGIETPADTSSYTERTSRTHSPLTVQVNIEEDL